MQEANQLIRGSWTDLDQLYHREPLPDCAVDAISRVACIWRTRSHFDLLVEMPSYHISTHHQTIHSFGGFLKSSTSHVEVVASVDGPCGTALTTHPCAVVLIKVDKVGNSDSNSGVRHPCSPMLGAD